MGQTILAIAQPKCAVLVLKDDIKSTANPARWFVRCGLIMTECFVDGIKPGQPTTLHAQPQDTVLVLPDVLNIIVF